MSFVYFPCLIITWYPIMILGQITYFWIGVPLCVLKRLIVIPRMLLAPAMKILPSNSNRANYFGIDEERDSEGESGEDKETNTRMGIKKEVWEGYFESPLQCGVVLPL